MGVGIDGKRETRRGTGRVLMDFVGMQISVGDRPDGEEACQKTRNQQAHPQSSSRHLHGRTPSVDPYRSIHKSDSIDNVTI